jgi:hypothetical protein
MYYLLHHSTGTLMLDAHDREAVLSWTERQLGEAAKRVAVVELSDDSVYGWVEKSGTGIRRAGCEAFLSVMADSIQRVAGSESSYIQDLDRFLAHETRCRKSAIH